MVRVMISCGKTENEALSLGMLDSDELVEWELRDVHDCDSLVFIGE